MHQGVYGDYDGGGVADDDALETSTFFNDDITRNNRVDEK
jgi:hypothetical protein